MYERSRRRQLTALAGLLAAAIVCITIDFRQPDGGPVDRLQRLAIAAFGPLQRGAGAVVRPVADLAAMPGELGGLRDHNRRLEAEVARLRAQERTYADVLGENRRLRGALAMAPRCGCGTVGATVVAGSGSNFQLSVTIDVGSRQRVARNMAVIDADGLVGRVTQVTADYATVLLVTDPSSGVAATLAPGPEAVPVGRRGGSSAPSTVKGGKAQTREPGPVESTRARTRVSGPAKGTKTRTRASGPAPGTRPRTRVPGIVKGSGEQLLSFQPVRAGTQVRRGDPVLTQAYQGGIFPAGLPIGVVERVDPAGAASLVPRVAVRPYAALGTLDVVAVVVDHPPRPRPRPRAAARPAAAGSAAAGSAAAGSAAAGSAAAGFAAAGFAAAGPSARASARPAAIGSPGGGRYPSRSEGAPVRPQPSSRPQPPGGGG